MNGYLADVISIVINVIIQYTFRSERKTFALGFRNTRAWGWPSWTRVATEKTWAGTKEHSDMRSGSRIAVIIPAINEEQSIGEVVCAIPDWVDEIIVADNGSVDKTPEIAAAGGAKVVFEPSRGYGSACLAAMAGLNRPDVVVFLDGDFSDYPEEMGTLVDPILSGRADMVIGSRVLGAREPGALTPQALFGNWLACRLMYLFWKVRYTDLGPFRAIRYRSLMRLGMRDRDYGWTVEMQIKAAREGLRVMEVPVSYRRRIGKSKVSGTVRGLVGAGTKIIGTILVAAAGFLPASGPDPLPERVVIFTRYPEPGKTKTRLIPVLGAAAAAALHRRMTERTVTTVMNLAQKKALDMYVCYEGGSQMLMSRWLGQRVPLFRQGQGDLGKRMLTAFEESFRAGAERVVLIGTDLPGLSGNIIESAFDELGRHDVVLGPTDDGGYYLIALKVPQPGLFEYMTWGTGTVLSETMERTRNLRLSTALVQPLHDVDRPEDIAALGPELTPAREKREASAQISLTERISVIVPTLNEEVHLSVALERAAAADNVELVVVDAGSSDHTAQSARERGATVLQTKAGRARQMNAGAKEARGDILLFLHADTLLPLGWDHYVRSTLKIPGVSAGAFQFALDSELPGLRFIERAANFRSRRLQMPYGDQAFFVTRHTFHEIGGFPELHLMEDLEMARRLRRLGRVYTVPVAAVTSARRWEKLGVWRTSLVNQLLLVAYFLGVSPRVLARWYSSETR